MPTIDPYFKHYYERQAEKFRQLELKNRLIKLLLFISAVLLLAAGETVGYYWGNL